MQGGQILVHPDILLFIFSPLNKYIFKTTLLLNTLLFIKRINVENDILFSSLQVANSHNWQGGQIHIGPTVYDNVNILM